MRSQPNRSGHARIGIADVRFMMTGLSNFHIRSVRSIRIEGGIVLTVHARSNCPLKETLLIPWDKAEELVSMFAKDAFGSEALIRVKRETLIRRLMNKFMETYNGAIAPRDRSD